MLKVKEENPTEVFTLSIYKSWVEMSHVHEISLNSDYISIVAIQDSSNQSHIASCLQHMKMKIHFKLQA